MRISKGKGGKKPRSTYMDVAFWRDIGGTGIHLATNDPGAPSTFHVLVRADGSKASGHSSLWKQLDKCLKMNGM